MHEPQLRKKLKKRNHTPKMSLSTHWYTPTDKHKLTKIKNATTGDGHGGATTSKRCINIAIWTLNYKKKNG
jgi:hypothetical protein